MASEKRETALPPRDVYCIYYRHHGRKCQSVYRGYVPDGGRVIPTEWSIMSVRMPTTDQTESRETGFAICPACIAWIKYSRGELKGK